MGTILDLMVKIKQLNEEFPRTVEESIKSNPGTIREITQDQLMSGLDEDMRPLKPTYLTDPYFKTEAEARRYMEWKRRITPPIMSDILHLPPRDEDTPNLIIRGDYYDSITPSVVGSGRSAKLVVRSEGFYAGDDIENKYGKGHLGLTDKGKAYLISEKISPAVAALLKRLGFK